MRPLECILIKKLDQGGNHDQDKYAEIGNEMGSSKAVKQKTGQSDEGGI